jgi:hypothetical protein
MVAVEVAVRTGALRPTGTALCWRASARFGYVLWPVDRGLPA